MLEDPGNTIKTVLNRKTLLVALGIIILALGTILAFYLVGQKQIFNPRAGGIPADPQRPVTSPETSFTLATGGTTFSVNDVVKVSVRVRADIDAANLFAAKLKFPNDLLQVTSITTGQKSICIPRPTCLDVRYPCKIAVPLGGWCSTTPTPVRVTPPPLTISTVPKDKTPICPEVITRACFGTDPQICRDFPRPCDVPEGWVIGEAGNVQGEATGSSTYFIQDWVEKYFDNKNGVISLVGGVASPGFKTVVGVEDGLMADIYFKAKSSGIANIVFSNDSAIFRNLDNTNILTIKREAAFKIQATAPSPSPSACKKGVDQFSLNTYCPGGAYRYANYSCQDGFSGTLGDGASCKKSFVFKEEAERICGGEDHQVCSQPVLKKISSLEGDINGDSKVDLVDLSTLLSRLQNPSGGIGNADVNGDGRVNTLDYSLLYNVLARSGVVRNQVSVPRTTR